MAKKKHTTEKSPLHPAVIFLKFLEAKSHPNYAVFNVLRFSPLGALLEVPPPPRQNVETNNCVLEDISAQRHKKGWNPEKGCFLRRDDVFPLRMPSFHFGFGMLVDWDGS